MILKRMMEKVAREVFARNMAVMMAMCERPTTDVYAHVRVQLDDGAYMPERAHPTDAGADLRCIESFTIPAKSSRYVDTGVHVELPPNTVGMIKSKSGLNIKTRLVTEGVIDEGYTGSIVVCIYNHGEYPYEFRAGDKVAQLVVLPCLYPTFELVERIEGGERADSGFGSTGR